MSIRAAESGDVPTLTAIQNALLVSTTYEWTETPHTGHRVLVAVFR